MKNDDWLQLNGDNDRALGCIVALALLMAAATIVAMLCDTFV